MLPTLDARLTAAAELVLPGKPVADIGCDHGKLTAVLAASGRYPKVIGADLRPGPLAKAKQTLEHAGCEDRAKLPFQKSLLDGELPYTVGGGIGQSRICMYYLRKAHIGEVHSSMWPESIVETASENGIHLL